METGTLWIKWLDGSEEEFPLYHFPCVPRAGDFLQVVDEDFGAVVTRVMLWIDQSFRVPSFTVEAREVCDLCDEVDCVNQEHRELVTVEGGG